MVWEFPSGPKISTHSAPASCVGVRWIRWHVLSCMCVRVVFFWRICDTFQYFTHAPRNSPMRISRRRLHAMWVSCLFSWVWPPRLFSATFDLHVVSLIDSSLSSSPSASLSGSCWSISPSLFASLLSLSWFRSHTAFLLLSTAFICLFVIRWSCCFHLLSSPYNSERCLRRLLSVVVICPCFRKQYFVEYQ